MPGKHLVAVNSTSLEPPIDSISYKFDGGTFRLLFRRRVSIRTYCMRGETAQLAASTHTIQDDRHAHSAGPAKPTSRCLAKILLIRVPATAPVIRQKSFGPFFGLDHRAMSRNVCRCPLTASTNPRGFALSPSLSLSLSLSVGCWALLTADPLCRLGREKF